MSRKNMACWAAANFLADVGELMAHWLEGRIPAQPAYDGRVDVDERFYPGLTRALAGFNRAGFVTDQSQAGCDDTSRYSQAPWEAFVHGFATEPMFERIRRHLDGTPFGVYAFPPANRQGRPQPVGKVPDELIYLDYPEGEIRFLYSACGSGAVQALCDAWQVTVYDTVPGRNDLWPVLTRAVG